MNTDREVPVELAVQNVSVAYNNGHVLTAANSEPPAKFMPVIISISSQLMPF